METEAQGLIAEAARMKKDAERMNPNVVASKTVPEGSATFATAKKRGRPAKVVATNAVQ